MTQKIYETDSYVQSFTARVLQCSPAPGGFAVVLDRTAFFPEGGGQPCDTGTLGGARVLAVSTDGETVTIKVEGDDEEAAAAAVQKFLTENV